MQWSSVDHPEDGSGVKHVFADGSLEDHPQDFEMPDFIAGEEAVLQCFEVCKLTECRGGLLDIEGSPKPLQAEE